MGFFSLKAECGCCGKECSLNRFKIKKSNAWLCPECLKEAGGLGKIDVSKMTIEDISEIIKRKRIASSERGLNGKYPSTAKEMYMYAKDNGYGNGFTDSLGIKHFQVIEDSLLPGEYVLMTFIGLHNYISATKHDNNFAYAITNKRIIMAQKNIIAGEKIHTIYLDNLNDISFKSGIALGVMTIDTTKEVFNVGLDKISAKAINEKAHSVIDEIMKSKKITQHVHETSSADEILRFKQLLDSGIITEEEFSKKKKQLLGL